MNVKNTLFIPKVASSSSDGSVMLWNWNSDKKVRTNILPPHLEHPPVPPPKFPPLTPEFPPPPSEHPKVFLLIFGFGEFKFLIDFLNPESGS